MQRAFISYTKERMHWAKLVKAELEKLGYAVYAQFDSSVPGEPIGPHIVAELAQTHLFVPLLCPEYFASGFCNFELEHFHHEITATTLSGRSIESKLRRIVPIRLQLDDSSHPAVSARLAEIVLTTFPEPDEAAAEVLAQELARVLLPVEPSHRIIQDYGFASDRAAQSDPNVGVDQQLSVRAPNFLLLKRADSYVLAIVYPDTSVDFRRLQQTNEPQTLASIAKRDEMLSIGFTDGFVHPLFHDPHHLISRVIVDGAIWAQLSLFPESGIQLPYFAESSERKVTISAAAFHQLLRALHSARLVFANICSKRWRDNEILTALDQADHYTRFAPTPSGGLHIGNARAALLPYALYRKNPTSNKFILRYDDTQEAAQFEQNIGLIGDDLRWLQITPSCIFKESAPERQVIYAAILNLLQRKNYAVVTNDNRIVLIEKIRIFRLRVGWI